MAEYIIDTTNMPPELMEELSYWAKEELVRCRDCTSSLAKNTVCGWWDYGGIEDRDGFCAWGERR